MVLYEEERSGNVGYLYFQQDANLNFPEHFHDSYEIVCVTDGEMLCTVCGRTYTLKAGEGLMVLPGQVHAYQTPGWSRSRLFVFSGDMIPDFDALIRDGRRPESAKFPCERQELQWIESRAEGGNVYQVKSWLYCVCGKMELRGKAESAPPCRDEELKEKISGYIGENYSRELTLKEVAQELGYSYSYLSDRFNHLFGIGFPAMVNGYRLEQACRYLSSTSENITTISICCGFSSIRNFNRAFLGRYNLSPTAYRKSMSVGA